MSKDFHPAVNPSPPPATEAVAGSAVDEVPLPDFVRRSAAGVFVQPDVPGRALQMQRFVDRVFSSGACFRELDYGALTLLLYGAEGRDAGGGRPLRLAAAIQAIEPERRELYKAPKAVGNGARVEYLFTPVWIERTVEVPIFGETGDDGQPQLSGYEKQVRQHPTRLDIDEFIAAMWLNGVRYGIDVAAVRAAIESAQGERVDIARRVDPTPGTDATVREQTQALHRDDSPAILANGRIDLGQFKNHFPQVGSGTRLLQKVPRALGQPGRGIDGGVLEAALPRDFAIDDLAGPGTRVERNAKGEFLVAAMDGFLNIDKATQQISVTEKIINREGVNQRTTGNLVLYGDRYEEHGEVQEHRTVEGHHMSFHADVFGNVVSGGGDLHFRANLAGGTVRNSGGTVKVEGRISNATIDARGCEVSGGHAESATIIADRLHLGRAVACDIVAEEVDIDEAVSCSIAARRIRIRKAASRRDVDCLVNLCLPDYSGLDKARTEAEKAIAELAPQLAERQRALDALAGAPEMRAYLAAEQRIREGGVALTPAQEAQWRKATQRLAGTLQEIDKLRRQLAALLEKRGEHEARLAELDAQRTQAAAGNACDIVQVAGATVVQSFGVPPEAPVLADIEAKKLRHVLHDLRLVRDKLFVGESGRYAWVAPQQPATEGKQ